jgi:maleate isomerase
MRGSNPASYSVLTAQDMIRAMRSIDGDDIEAIVQFGANLPMGRLADEAERWLDKPVISVNVATYWHALRTNGINDRIRGFTRLLSEF